jgi:HD-like signal output (HDOD) protein/GGDEF domain-containing protein
MSARSGEPGMTETLSPVVEALVRADDLPSLPAVALEVINLCRSEDTSLSDLAEVVSMDPTLAAKLLGFANSSLYNVGHEITSLQRASLVLGLKTVQLMALSFSLAESLQKRGSSASFDYEQYWRRSLASAVAGRSLAGLLDTFLDDEAFLCGLLGEIGQLVLAECMPQEYRGVLEEAGESWPTPALERGILGFDHCEVGMAVLRSWNLPPVIYRGVQHARAPEELPDDAPAELRTITRVGHLAALTVEVLTSTGKGESLAVLEETARGYFGLSPDSVYEFITSLESGIRETSELIDLPLPGGKSAGEILEDARIELLKIDASDAREPDPLDTDPEPGESARPRPSSRGAARELPDEEAFDARLHLELDQRLQSESSPPLGMLRVSIDGYAELEESRDLHVVVGVRQDVEAILRRMLRSRDLAASFGGAEFGIVAPGATPLGLRSLAERLREAVERLVCGAGEETWSPTISVAGVCLTSPSSARDAQVMKELTRRLVEHVARKGGNACHVQSAPMRL